MSDCKCTCRHHYPDNYPVTHGELRHRLQELWDYVLEQSNTVSILGEKLSVTQADLDALATSIAADVSAIQAEIAALEAANPNLDLSGLQAAVASLDATANPAPPAV
ncbi:MAG: hypothetical protein JWO11_3514 [Nocardioides sp.]|nr:hypothetical protein [Nocardioides sp.]